MTGNKKKLMTEPMTILNTPEDIVNAPTATILCKETAPLNALVVGIHPHEELIEKLPLRVLRWGQFRYPTGFDDARLPTLADMTTEEREKSVLMQAQDAKGKLCIILYVSSSGASVLYKDGANGSLCLDSVTPRPDLPRLEWPSSEPEPEYRVGKTLETLEDFQNTPIGTVAIDADRDIMRKKDQGSWAITDELAVVNTDEVHRWYTRPAKIIAVVGDRG
ncbi:hypothetical protein I4J23_07420 [Corynebacterium diphtheriae bv. mitis]|uniref:hypothetical protein n=1 Tax=Corynebacterium diphtheriae TaxID=1717 RepID=UPI0013CBAFF2|nr:hypothetical protein [Corynebacterium diphtheriae]MBG9303669.1 hypothetical protein [Corynebacterium diphtheriae bv. mitis]CAB0889044.1 hypothetical protein FRC0430_00236 [Corynebacterium diphtheriae]CAB0938567.1 hypothetical protein FRC0436_00320 [Corynebacterium diphtheriae]